MRKYIIFYTLIFSCVILSFIYMKEVIFITKDTLNFVFFTLFPTLFPYMCLLMLCLNYGILDFLGYFMAKFFPYLHLSKISSSLFLSSLFSGYPTNITLILEAFKQRKLSLEECFTLIKCANFASPSFILMTLPKDILFPVYFSHIFPSFLYLFFFSKKPYSTSSYPFSFPKESFVYQIKTIFKKALFPFIFIFGFILVFRILSFYLKLILPTSFYYYCIGFLEFSYGITTFLDYYPVTLLSSSMLSFYLSFSGLSVIMQSDSLLDLFPHTFTSLIKYRFIHGITSFCLCFVLMIIKLGN